MSASLPSSLPVFVFENHAMARQTKPKQNIVAKNRNQTNKDHTLSARGASHNAGTISDAESQNVLLLRRRLVTITGEELLVSSFLHIQQHHISILVTSSYATNSTTTSNTSTSCA
mmetsp:Transcript_11058/g.32038  ORF Transcript_11058/g.32038 Transcript_11058/m.32038 type:complete len:115 (+) Transcript_11058:475-819(+)